MMPETRNAGGQPGVSCNQLGGWLHFPSTALDRQAQMLAARFRLSPWMARDLALLSYGERET
jgi:hypothetical protein